MRNILVFPDGSEQDFQYPSNRIIAEGEKIEVQFKDGSSHYLKVSRIEKTEQIIYFHLTF